jgi:hypothetical protein
MTTDTLNAMASWARSWTPPRGVTVPEPDGVRTSCGVLVVVLCYRGVRREERYPMAMDRMRLWAAMADDAVGLIRTIDGLRPAAARARRADFTLSTTGLGGDGA